ncbi:pancreatic triacylglycerol lipase-like isoform X2 [Daktulosphaira vitifoliae]|uniref:pancreatic triacylglycerol lipase-like isoform X2 n=1 Tax=Daktulosphaira vitifoliae TaxID=58002 RepID=UPI0021A979EA|nr:pancreatic triacylglycerol lipase-like isoform X2 [Daktulosphaira vitifoliae]
MTLSNGILLVFSLILGSCLALNNNTYSGLLASLSEHENIDSSENNFEIDTSSNIQIEREVFFWLYTREQNMAQKLIPGVYSTLLESSFNAENPTKIVIHGWLGDPDKIEKDCQILKNEYLIFGNYNVICVDWRKISHDITYVGARIRCKQIGYYLAQLVEMLRDVTSQSFEKIHILGFSMGAHIAGYAGKKLNSRIGRITGLDPAKPLFFTKWPNHRLSEDDAMFVDVIHSSDLFLGLLESIGNVDFFPNGGHARQPGCAYNDYCN